MNHFFKVTGIAVFAVNAIAFSSFGQAHGGNSGSHTASPSISHSTPSISHPSSHPTISHPTISHPTISHPSTPRVEPRHVEPRHVEPRHVDKPANKPDVRPPPPKPVVKPDVKPNVKPDIRPTPKPVVIDKPRPQHPSSPGTKPVWRPTHTPTHTRQFEQVRREEWHRQIGSHPQFVRTKAAGNWNYHFDRWSGYWATRSRIIADRRLYAIESALWLSYWRTRYSTTWYYYPPYAMEQDYYYVDREPDFQSEPEPFYMEAVVKEYLPLRSAPEVDSKNVCGAVPSGAMIPVSSVISTSAEGKKWAMIQVTDEVREFFVDDACMNATVVFAALDYLK